MIICNKEGQEDSPSPIFLLQNAFFCLGEENTALKWNYRLNVGTVLCSSQAQVGQKVRHEDHNILSSNFKTCVLTLGVEFRSYVMPQNPCNMDLIPGGRSIHATSTAV